MWRLESPQAEHGTRWSAAAPRLDVVAVVAGQVDVHEPGAVLGGEALGVAAGVVAVALDPEADVEPVGAVAQPQQDVPQRQRVLPARDGHEHPVAWCDHRVLFDDAFDLVTAVGQEAALAEPGVVAAHLDDRRFAANPAFHELGGCGGEPGLDAHGPSRDDRADLDLRTLGDGAVARHERPVDDHEHGLPLVTELVEQRQDADRAGDFDLAPRVAKQDFHAAHCGPWERGE